MKRSMQLVPVLMILVLVACGDGGEGPVASLPVRDRLLVRDLFGANTAEMVDNDYFLPIGELAPHPHEFSGSLDREEGF